MSSGIRRILLIAAFSLLSATAQAGPFSIRVDPPDALKVIRKNPSWNIVLEGEIDPAAPGRVEAALKKVGPAGADVYIDSPGGNLFAGMEIGRLLRRARAKTHVGTLAVDPSRAALTRLAGRPAVKVLPGYCYSACSLAFLGGIRRSVPQGSAYGVHRFSSGPGWESDVKTSQVAAAAVTAYIRDMGADPRLFDLMLGKASSGIRTLSTRELLRLRVVTSEAIRR